MKNLSDRMIGSPLQALRFLNFLSLVFVTTLPTYTQSVNYDIKVVVSYLAPGVLQPTGHSVNKMACEEFSKYFPFNTNCKGALSVGQVCNLYYFNTNNPVRIEKIDFDSFTLVSLPGHAEGANRRITFKFENKYNRIYLYVHAEGPSSWPSWASKYGMVAKDIWNTYGTLLKNGIDSGIWKQYGGQMG